MTTPEAGTGVDDERPVRIVMTGRILDGFDRAKVQVDLAKVARLDSPAVERLLNGAPHGGEEQLLLSVTRLNSKTGLAHIKTTSTNATLTQLRTRFLTLEYAQVDYKLSRSLRSLKDPFRSTQPSCRKRCSNITGLVRKSDK